MILSGLWRVLNYKPFPVISDDRSGKIIKRNKSIARKGCFYEGI